MKARFAVEPSNIASIVLLPFFFFNIHYCFGIVLRIRTIRGSPTHRPLYIFFQRSEPVLCIQSDALDLDLQPKQLSSSVPKHTESLALSLIAIKDSLCTKHYKLVGEIQDKTWEVGCRAMLRVRIPF
jgi:hypothetical protein